jgi:hypothetical protein
LHTKEEFSEILANAKNGMCLFFNNDLAWHEDATTHTEPAFFIFSDDPGPMA